MSSRAALAALALAGGAYFYWQQRQQAEEAAQGGQGIAQPDALAPASEWLQSMSYRPSSMEKLGAMQVAQKPQGGSDMKLNFAPLIGWGLDRLGSWIGNASKSDAGPPPSSGSSGATSSGGSWLAGLFGPSESTPRNAAPKDRAGLVGSLQTLIGQAEAPQGYNQVYGGSRLKPPRPITTMTVSEVLEWQDRSVGAGSASSAAGRYQVIRGTLRDMVKQGVVSPSDTFDAETQDRISVALMERRGLREYERGQITAEQFGQRLSQEWAGLPAITRDRKGRAAQGQSYYAGDGLNRATVSRDRLLNALKGNAGGWV